MSVHVHGQWKYTGASVVTATLKHLHGKGDRLIYLPSDSTAMKNNSVPFCAGWICGAVGKCPARWVK